MTWILWDLTLMENIIRAYKIIFIQKNCNYNTQVNVTSARNILILHSY